MDSLYNFLELAIRWIFSIMSLVFGVHFLIQAWDQHREFGVALFIIMTILGIMFLALTFNDTKKFLRGEDF